MFPGIDSPGPWVHAFVMNNRNPREHWNSVYETKALTDVSWYQTEPVASWKLMNILGVDRHAPVIDVGGGDSLFVDFLLSHGFTDITVLDISDRAIERAKARVGATSAVSWVVEDVTNFRPHRQYALWHDRAVLHFLTEESQVSAYLESARSSLLSGGQAVVGTFSDRGPLRCSGLTVQQYSQASLSSRFARWFNKVQCIDDQHLTPSQAIQWFTFCAFRLMAA